MSADIPIRREYVPLRVVISSRMVDVTAILVLCWRAVYDGGDICRIDDHREAWVTSSV